MKGKAFHNDAVETSCQDLEAKGWRVLRVNERLPTWLATKDGQVWAICPVPYYWKPKRREWVATKPLTTLLRHFHALDGVHAYRYRHGKQDPTTALETLLRSLRANGWNLIYKGRKTPDALAIKDGKLWAVEVLTTGPKSGLLEYAIRSKREAYGMFDGCHVQVVRHR